MYKKYTVLHVKNKKKFLGRGTTPPQIPPYTEKEIPSPQTPPGLRSLDIELLKDENLK